MGRTRPPYPPGFRVEAVRLVPESGKSAYRIAQDLGVAEQSLRNWVKQADLDSGRHSDGLTTEQREILRRAAAYFAQETGPRRPLPSAS